MIEGIENVEEWLDPQYHYTMIQEIATVDEHLSMMKRIQQSIRKLSFSFGSKRSSSSSNKSSSNSRPLSLQPSTVNPSSNMHRLSQPALLNKPYSITPTVSLSTGHTLIFNSNISDDSTMAQ